MIGISDDHKAAFKLEDGDWVYDIHRRREGILQMRNP